MVAAPMNVRGRADAYLFGDALYDRYVRVCIYVCEAGYVKFVAVVTR